MQTLSTLTHRPRAAWIHADRPGVTDTLLALPNSTDPHDHNANTPSVTVEYRRDVQRFSSSAAPVHVNDTSDEKLNLHADAAQLKVGLGRITGGTR